MWRTIDPGHAAYDPAVAGRFSHAIDQAYLKVDELVGQLRDRLPGDADIVVVSPTASYTARRLVDLNRWLADEGVLTWRDPPGAGHAGCARRRQPLDRCDRLVTNRRTRGRGGPHLSQCARARPSRHGRTRRAYDALVARLRERLEALTDPISGRRVVARVRAASEAYAGPLLERLPTSWSRSRPATAGPGTACWAAWPTRCSRPTTERWSAEHASADEATVPGVWLSSMPLTGDSMSVLDVAPTVLQYFAGPSPRHRWRVAPRTGSGRSARFDAVAMGGRGISRCANKPRVSAAPLAQVVGDDRADPDERQHAQHRRAHPQHALGDGLDRLPGQEEHEVRHRHPSGMPSRGIRRTGSSVRMKTPPTQVPNVIQSSSALEMTTAGRIWWRWHRRSYNCGRMRDGAGWLERRWWLVAARAMAHGPDRRPTRRR